MEPRNLEILAFSRISSFIIALFCEQCAFSVSGQNATGQNATMSKTDKMPQCKWFNKDTANMLQGCNKSATRVYHSLIRM